MGAFYPISKVSRIEVVDILRGFALFGVLLANVPFDGELAESNEVDRFLGFLYDIFINRKFITLFSILFGFGFYIQMTRAFKKGIDFNRYFLKRMALLFLIGSAHCFLIWNGDIIMSYAFGGVFLLLVKNWSVKRLTLFAILFSVVLTGVIFIGNSFLGWQEHTYDFNLVQSYPIVGSYPEYLGVNYRIAPWTNFWQDMPLTLVFTFGNMLIGFILGKISFFVKRNSLRILMNTFIVLGFTIGLLCSYLFHLVNAGKLDVGMSLAWLPFVVIGGMLLQTLGYMALFVKLGTIPIVKRLTSWFKYVGRTALTNYIFQSLFYLLVIFHAVQGYGLYGKISRAETYLLAILFFTVQSLVSYLWLKKNNQGPIEYLWKKWSYTSRFTITKRAANVEP